MKAYIYNLVFEVTRKCNLCCDHCLRGEAQNVDLSKETVDRVLDHIDSIGCLTLSGGEPTLNMPIMRYIFNEVQRRGISLGSFYVVTNGIENQMELSRLLLENITYCNEPEMCGVAISKDIFHDNLKFADVSPIHYLSFCRDDKESGDFHSMKGIIRRGRAASPDFYGGRTEDPSIDFESNVWQDTDGKRLEIMNNFYVSAAGEICADCDLSYDMMSDYLVTTVDELPSFFNVLKEETAA